MKKVKFSKKNLFFILLFIAIFTTLFTQFKTYATINFNFTVLNSKTSHIDGQVYYSKNGAYNSANMTPFMLRHNEFNVTKEITIPLYHKDIHFIRFDPLNRSGEVVIHNFNVVQGYGFHKKVQKINFMDIDFSHAHHIRVLHREKNFVHLQCTGTDPYTQLINNLNISTYLLNYIDILTMLLISFSFVFLIYIIVNNIQSKHLHGEEIVTALIILLYSIYTFFYANQFYFSEILLLAIPPLGIYIIYRQGMSHYINYFRDMFIVLFILSITVFISYYFNHIDNIHLYLTPLTHLIIPAMLTSMLFIQKKSFNFHFYKHFLILLTLFLSGLSIAFHYDLISVDTIITFGYKMSMSEWSQKNYTFWYLILMWTSISFLHWDTNNKKELLIILLIFITSAVAIMSGYSDSAKLAFWVSVGAYIAFVHFNFSIKFLHAIPLLIVAYILLTPWLSDVYAYLSDLHPRLQGRQSIFTIFPDMIKHHLFLGYGFNHTTGLIPSNYVSQEVLAKFSDDHWIKHCVPHSVFLFAWLNVGLLGVSLLSLLIYKALNAFIQITYQKHNQPALLSLIIAFMIIFSFSWGNLMAYAILTYSFLIGMIFLSLNINSKQEK